MKQLTLSIFFALLAACQNGAERAQDLPMSHPEAEGVSSQGVLAFIKALEKEVDAPHGVVVLRHGKIVAEGWWSPFERQTPHMLYSLSKSFTSTAIGMAVDEGRLTVDDKVLSFFPEDAPPDASENLRAMRVRDLLTMTTGHAKDTLPPLTRGTGDNWARTFLAQPVEHKPGTHFLYNTGATYMLSAILQRVTGQTLMDYLTPRLFEPLGIANPTWETDPRGINVGGWGLKITTTDIAKFGQLYLHKGVWNGKRLLSESWVEAATARQVPNGDNPDSDWSQGYGYQFWRSRHNAYRGDGAFGQFCVVMPERDAVVAITAGVRDMQHVLYLIWKHLAPAMHDSPLPPDDDAHAALTQKLKALRHTPVEGEPSSPLAAQLNGQRFTLAPNDTGMQGVSFDFTGDKASVTIHTSTGDRRFTAAAGGWHRQVVHFEKLGLPAVATTRPEAVATSGAWTAPNRYVMRAWLYETPYRLDLEFTFDPDHGKVTIQRTLHPIQAQPTRLEGTLP